jgi:hypothetical protein
MTFDTMLERAEEIDGQVMRSREPVAHSIWFGTHTHLSVHVVADYVTSLADWGLRFFPTCIHVPSLSK